MRTKFVNFGLLCPSHPTNQPTSHPDHLPYDHMNTAGESKAEEAILLSYLLARPHHPLYVTCFAGA